MSSDASLDSATTPDIEQSAIERAEIDESCQIPVLLFFGGAVFWLLIGTAFALIASIKLHYPEFLERFAWLTFGRVRPAHLNTVAYGWASQAGVGVILWLMARLCHAKLRTPRLLVWAWVLWNVGVTIGTIGILAGQGTSIEWLEFPAYAPPFFVAAFLIITTWSMLMWHDRREGHVYVSQWYLFGAVFWFPWLYTVANLLLLISPVRGVTLACVNWWYGHNTLGLWLTPIGLAAAYYLMPKVLGRPIYSYYLSIIGFWSLALFYNWAGMHHLIGGPVPAWLVTVSIVGSVMMMIPVGAVAINHHMTMVRHFPRLRTSPTLRFVVFGAMSYTAVSIQGALQSLRTVNEVAHFTHYTIAHAHLGVYAFYSMIMFGSMYYIVPRLTGWEWASSRMIRIHFWCATLGILSYFLFLSWGGWYQGRMLNDPNVPFMEIVTYTRPWLRIRSWSGALLAVGHVTFAILFFLNVFKLGRERLGPTLFWDVAEPAAAKS